MSNDGSPVSRIRLRLLAVVTSAVVAGVVAVVGAAAAQRAGVSGDPLVERGSAQRADTETLTFGAELRVK
jgi:hypothetical protein